MGYFESLFFDAIPEKFPITTVARRLKGNFNPAFLKWRLKLKELYLMKTEFSVEDKKALLALFKTFTRLCSYPAAKGKLYLAQMEKRDVE